MYLEMVPGDTPIPTFPLTHPQIFPLQLKLVSGLLRLMCMCHIPFASSSISGIANMAPPGWLSGERVGLMTWWLSLITG